MTARVFQQMIPSKSLTQLKALILCLTTSVLIFTLSLHAIADDTTSSATENRPVHVFDQWVHGSALSFPIKYKEGFEHFDYVNPDAPKTGTVRLEASGNTFDSFNALLPKGDPAEGLGLVWESLMTPSLDEVGSSYGLIAEAKKYPADFSKVSFRINKQAKWHDGKPITVEDVIWSFNSIREISPAYTQYYRNVERVEKTGDHEVTFYFDQKNNKELPHIVSQLLVLPKHWWEGKDSKGNQRSIKRSTLEIPLGSGPYRIKSFNAGKNVTYERVKDYWGKDLNVNIGTNNFDIITYEYFSDEAVSREAFKADGYDWRQETTAKEWATSYDIPAVKDDRIILKEYDQPYKASGIGLGFIFNLRREKFQDIRVRKALNMTFDFESMNKTLFFNQYSHINSFFYGLPFASNDLPKGKELEILSAYKDQLPEEVFTTPYENSIHTKKNTRKLLRSALKLLKEAGYERKGSQLIHKASGKPLEIEFLLRGNRFEKIALRLQRDFKLLGVKLNIRIVDDSQYTNRLRSFDYDLIYQGWPQSFSPGNEQRQFFGSKAADHEGSRNYAGVKDPVVDELIEKIIYSDNRETLEVTTKALDRVLLAKQFLIPGWTKRSANIARWDRFSHPEPLPEHAIGFPQIWWWDEEKAKRVTENSN